MVRHSAKVASNKRKGVQEVVKLLLDADAFTSALDESERKLVGALNKGGVGRWAVVGPRAAALRPCSRPHTCPVPRAPAVIDLHQQWCGPCTVMEPMVRKMFLELDNVENRLSYYTVRPRCPCALAASRALCRTSPPLPFFLCGSHPSPR